MNATLRVPETKRTNPLDATMTKAQVVRRVFKSSLPRKPEHVELSAMEALARTFELLARFRNEMGKAELSRDDVQAGLVYCQPKTKGQEAVISQTVVLPKPDPADVGEFAEKVMALDKPVFLGVLFLQHDAKAEKAGDVKQANVLFGIPFTTVYDAPARMLAARASQMLKGKGTKLTN